MATTLPLLSTIIVMSSIYRVRSAVSPMETRVQIVTPGYLGPLMPSTIMLCGPAFVTGLRYLRLTYPHLNFSHSYLYDPKGVDSCVSFADDMVLLISKWLYRDRDPDQITVIMTPSCIDQRFFELNQLAAEWNILLMSSGDVLFHDKHLTPTWVRAGVYSNQHTSGAYNFFFALYNWTSVYIMEEFGPLLFYHTFGSYIMRRSRGIQFVYNRYNAPKTADKKFNFTNYLVDFKGRSRVMMFCGPSWSLRNLLVQAHSRNMTTDEYVYIAALPFPYERYGTFGPEAGDQDYDVIRAAYKSVLLFTAIDETLDPTANLSAFAPEWSRLFRTDPFYRNMDLREPPYLRFIPSLFRLKVVNETVSSIKNFDTLNSGAALARKFWNRTFQTTTGYISLDSYGDRKPMNSFACFDGAQFQVFLRSDPNAGDDYRWIKAKKLQWHGFHDQLPPNEPYCGYDGLKTRCHPKGSDGMNAALFAIAAGLFCSTALLLWHARRRYIRYDKAWYLLDSSQLRFSHGASFSHRSNLSVVFLRHSLF
ncbi:hypothetical protein BV898_06257 [Hypsibius exemplaris]|uniref:Receptor ligand binding region domain-containing protein n=1 Tax=Hypsibius exemplaris TaxID=2072580 RepID=A0A1W0WWZ4_HYPEX|nr:hypothetical protein BV898_06257 [Hypsibius exemplaris]